jgi:Holliday junction resolvasome RuvABC ATP-dependent DNA helicase subunit
LIKIFLKIEVHEHAGGGQEDTLFISQRPNSSALFTGREDIIERLKDHFAGGDGCRKSFLLYGMGGIGKTQICLKFVEEMAGR